MILQPVFRRVFLLAILAVCPAQICIYSGACTGAGCLCKNVQLVKDTEINL